MRVLCYVATLVLLLVPVGFARDLSLQETVRLAKEHSLELKKANLMSQSAKSQFDIATARRYPTLSVDARAMAISDVPSFTINLPFGQSMSRELGSKEIYQTDVTLALPLYAGGRITSGVHAGRALMALNDAIVRADVDQVMLQARVSYLGLYRADRMVTASQAALDRATIIQKNVQSMYDAGAADSVALLESRLTVTDSRLAVQEATTSRRQQEIRLLILLGLDPSESIAVTDSFEVPTSDISQTSVSPQKPELIAATSRIDLQKASLRSSKSGYLPTISLFGGYSFGKPNRDQFNGGFDDYFSVGARAQWSFNFGNETGGHIAVARYDLQSAELAQQQVDEQLNCEASLAFEQVRLARERYNNARERAEVASQNYRLATAQHTDGALPTNRLLEIEQTLAAAEAGRAAAIADYFIAQSSYLYAIGSDLTQEGN